MPKVPEHVAIIMDGNGRWAQQRGKVRTEGHYAGTKNVRNIAIYANDLGIKCLTLYAFSTENWKRPATEVNYLMSLPKLFFSAYIKELMEKNIKIEMIGNMDEIPNNARKIFSDAIAQTKNNTGMILNFAVNYGSQNEIVQGVKRYAAEVSQGLRENNLDEDEFKHYLMTDGLPDVDLLIRTSGEERISNFLLYQIAYSEFVFTDVLWPDFDGKELDKCLDIYYGRHRRFGGLDEDKNN